MSQEIDPQTREPGRTGDKAEGGEPTRRFPMEENRQPSHAEGDPEPMDDGDEAAEGLMAQQPT